MGFALDELRVVRSFEEVASALVPPQATIMSLATPSAGLHVTPLLPSEPPQFVPSKISLAGINSRFTSFTCGTLGYWKAVPLSIGTITRTALTCPR